jgi:hypothetical protein
VDLNKFNQDFISTYFILNQKSAVFDGSQHVRLMRRERRCYSLRSQQDVFESMKMVKYFNNVVERGCLKMQISQKYKEGLDFGVKKEFFSRFFLFR